MQTPSPAVMGSRTPDVHLPKGTEVPLSQSLQHKIRFRVEKLNKNTQKIRGQCARHMVAEQPLLKTKLGIQDFKALT